MICHLNSMVSSRLVNVIFFQLCLIYSISDTLDGQNLNQPELRNWVWICGDVSTQKPGLLFIFLVTLLTVRHSVRPSVFVELKKQKPAVSLYRGPFFSVVFVPFLRLIGMIVLKGPVCKVWGGDLLTEIEYNEMKICFHSYIISWNIYRGSGSSSTESLMLHCRASFAAQNRQTKHWL